MAHSICLQDWTTIQGNANTITQQEIAYLNLLGYQDLVAYVEIAAISAATLSLQTSPTKDSAFFSNLTNSGGSALTYNTSGLQTLKMVRMSDGNVPLSRYVRWTAASGAGPFSITFRIWLNLTQAPGFRPTSAR